MLTKDELILILKKLQIPFNDSIQNLEENNSLPRLVFWEYCWEPYTASGKKYNTLVTYQLSFFSNISRDPILLKLRNEFAEKNIVPTIYIEYLNEKREFHSYFSIEVLENI